MEWLNYHHLRYFWTVAREGSLAAAAEKLCVSQPSISEQIHELESALGEKLFERDGRKNKLTDAGQIVFGYAEEIFVLGREMMNAIKQRPGAKALRLHVGIVDSFPKLVTSRILQPAFALPQNVCAVCCEGKMDDLLAQLAAHRLDIVLADEPAPSSVPFKTFDHPLGSSGTIICAVKKLAAQLRPGFPQSLNDAPALLPVQKSSLRRLLEAWFREDQLKPRVVAECEDLALLKALAAEGRGFIAIPEVAMDDAMRQYGFREIGRARRCEIQFHAITPERRIVHPAVVAITQNSGRQFSSARA
jgi:LysR family transcriptional regulator, transcriptional activator of nhaA